MKFSLKKMLVSGALAGIMTFAAAGAASFDSAAQSLSDLGLLSGTANGFDLDRASTRAESAAMLVRLLGKEAEANELWQTDAETFAFTDLEDSAWAKPYVNWLVKNGLAAGTTETTFAPRENCSAQMAATFLLRALGYSDAAGGDFTYATAMDFAREKGVVDLVNCDEANFRRDHLVAMCYTALSRPPKSGEADLLSKLITEGAIADNEVSKKTQEAFAGYREYSQASAGFAENESIATKVTADIDLTADGELVKMGMVQELAMKLDPDRPETMEMAMTGTVNITMGDESVSIPSTLYYKDSTAYVETQDTKMKVPMPMEEAVAQANLMNVQGASSEPVCAVESVTKTTEGGKTVYHVVYNAELLNNMVDTIMGSLMDTLPDLEDESTSVSISHFTADLTMNGDRMERMDMEMALGVSDGQSSVSMTMDMQMEILAIGDEVKIEYPASFDDYVAIEESAGDGTQPTP